MCYSKQCLGFALPHPTLIKMNCTLNYISCVEQVSGDNHGYLAVRYLCHRIDVYNSASCIPLLGFVHPLISVCLSAEPRALTGLQVVLQ